MRSLVGKMDFFDGAPHDELLTERSPNEAFCRGIAAREFAVYFTNGGSGSRCGQGRSNRHLGGLRRP